MKTAWRRLRRLGKISRQKRRQSSLRKMPVIVAFCSRACIAIRKVEHGYQFLRDEYIIEWAPSTNSVSIQYRLPGHSRTVPFTADGQPDKPRILVALEELADLVRHERPAVQAPTIKSIEQA